MLFERRLQAGLRDGSISIAFRRWRRPQVIAGRRYRSPIGMIEVTTIAVVDSEISSADAHAAGYASVDALLRDLKGPLEGQLFRLELRRCEDPNDPRDVLADDADLDGEQLAKLNAKLDRLDGGHSTPWTRATLAAIEANPGKRAGELAGALGWPELAPFKLAVRKLKALGLTLSLPVGYRLSPRGAAFLRQSRT